MDSKFNEVDMMVLNRYNAVSMNLGAVSCTKHVWYSEQGMYCRFKIILE